MPPALAGDLLRVLYQHRAATTAQLHRLLTPDAADASYLRRVLRQTAAAGLVDAVRRGSAGQRVWFLTGAGYTVVEASGEVEIRPHRMTAALAAGGLLAHRLAVVDTGIAFVAAARQRPADVCGPWSWAPEVLLQPGRRRGGAGALIADAVLRYERARPDAIEVHTVLVEVDRGTYPTARLAGKLATYAAWWRTPQRRAVFPDGRLLVVVDMPQAAAVRRIEVLAGYARDMAQLRRAGALSVGAAALSDLLAVGPWAPVCVDVVDEHKALVDVALQPVG